VEVEVEVGALQGAATLYPLVVARRGLPSGDCTDIAQSVDRPAG
jgi:hypothetical protein